MKVFCRVVLVGIMFALTGCGEPSESEIKQGVTEALQGDNRISKDFVETLDMKYGNGILIFYDNCPQLVKMNDEKIAKEFEKKEKARKNDVWGNLLAVGMGDNIWSRSIQFRDECQQMRYRASSLSQMIDGVKEVRLLK